MSALSIAIDGRNLMHPLSGSAAYIIAAMNALSQLKPDWMFSVLTNRPLHPACAERIIWRANVRHICKGYTRIGLLWYSTQLHLILKKLSPDFFWAPATLLPPYLPAGIKTIVTVNDLVAKEYRATMAPMNRLYSGFMFDRSIRNADILLAISHYTAREIENHYRERKAQKIEIGCGVDQSVFAPMGLSDRECGEITNKYGVKPPFLLFVGTLEPRKNLDFMLSLMPQLATNGLQLLVVGAKGWGKSRIAEIIQAPGFPKEKVVFAGYVPTGDLVKLYNTASVYISTSHNEGFGLPQLEAMNCGCPVVSPHNSAMIEVVEGAGITVQGWQKEDWYSAVHEATARREHYREQGLIRAAQYDWGQIAATLVERIVVA